MRSGSRNEVPNIGRRALAMVAGAALALMACRDSSAPPACFGHVDVTVTYGNPPSFTWAPRKRAGQHSIRVNDQFRVCFRWTPAGPEDVEIVDYH